jgi:drug/metabolite transporter (DMT)-like permease
MIDNPRTRRFLSAALILIGAVLIFLAPDDAWIGVVLAALGFAIEGIAVALGHRDKAKDRNG